MRSRLQRHRPVGVRCRGHDVLLGGCAVLIAVSGCGGGSDVGGSVHSGTPALGTATSRVTAGEVWTRLDIPGIAFRRPESWHSFPDPLGILPGPQWVIDVLTTQAAKPCSISTNRDGSGSAGCDWRLAPGGVEVMWSLQAQPTVMPETSTVIAGRKAIRTAGPASGDCRATGGTLESRVVLSGTADRRGVVELVVHACLANPGAASAETQVNTMLDTLVPWRAQPQLPTSPQPP
jgi:hypothetical protein